MARRVKLWDSPGEYGDSSTAYKVGTKYYTSKEAYESHQNDVNNRQEVIKLVHNLFGYEEHQMIPSIFLKKLKEWEPYGYDVVLQTVKDTSNSIEWALQNKSFSSEIGKTQYVSSIIANHLIDTEKKMKREKKTEEKINKVETMDLELTSTSNVKKGTDISGLLGGDDWI